MMIPTFGSAGRAPSGGPAFAVPGLRLRPCRDADLPFLRRLYRSTRAAELDATGWPEPMKRTFCDQQFDAQHTDYLRRFPQGEFLLLLDRKDPVGRVYLDASGVDLRLVDIALLPSARGRGLGGRVLHALLDRAAGERRGVVLSVDPANSRAAALYRRLGFVETGRDAARLHMRHPGGTPA